ncbi:MAG: FAD-dependent oxidoreductase [Promethearchaeota archaeon]
MSSDKNVLIIGGGVAGLQAAIELADCNVNVTIIDKQVYAGGNVQKLYKVFPTDDCSFCTVSTTLKPGIRKCFYRAGIKEHPRITLLTNCEVKEITGSIGNFKVLIKQSPLYVKDTCTRCGKCEEACPIEKKPMKWTDKPKKAIYLPVQQCIPQSYIIDRKICPPNCKICVEACPFEDVIDLNEKEKQFEIYTDAIILATGFREFDPSPLKYLKYGIYENVITQLELAQMLDPNGPTEGKLLRPSDKKPVRSIIMLQCVGSRDIEFQKYCSTICCSYACKHARIIKEERSPDAQIFIIYMDLRTFGVLERYYRECRELGIDFLRGQIAEVFQEPDGVLKIQAIDTLLQRPFEIVADLLVLTPALIPSIKDFALLNKIGVETDDYGFIESQIDDKTKTYVEGIYACGTNITPMDFSSSITFAKSAALNVLKCINSEEKQ